jgi:hypothetical protein
MQYGGGCTAVKDGLRRSARKGGRRRGCQHEQWVSSIAPARGGREGSGWGRASRKQRGDAGSRVFGEEAIAKQKQHLHADLPDSQPRPAAAHAHTPLAPHCAVDSQYGFACVLFFIS